MKKATIVLQVILLVAGVGWGCEGKFGTSQGENTNENGNNGEEDPCENAALVDGWYCGRSLDAGDLYTRYHCVGGETVDSEHCEYGCIDGQCVTPDACMGATDGWHCGDELGSGDADTQYHCVGGIIVEARYCEQGCKDGECIYVDECLGVANGWYCGDELGSDDADTRYHCMDGVVVETQYCEDGCLGGQCVTPDACMGATDGWYCGDELGSDDADTRYHCMDGVVVETQYCEDGCLGGECVYVDECLGAANGWHCGDELVSGDADTRYYCMDGVVVETQYCEDGCQNGECTVPDPCANATYGNGWYCEESLEAGDIDTLYHCVDGVTVDSEFCEFGCSRQPPGQNDMCAPDPSGYLLPLECGTQARVSQGNHGTFSHNGMSAWAFDFAIPRGTSLVACRGGTVTRVKNDILPGDPCWEGGGSECANNVNYVLIEHDDNTGTLYLHLDEAGVTVGTTVTRGQFIGLSGSTGYSTGPHLHLQRQELCSSWWCQSVPLSFDDVPFKNGVPETDDWVTSGNCP